MKIILLSSELRGRLPEEGSSGLDFLMQFSFFSTLFFIIAGVTLLVMTYALIKMIIDPINKNSRDFKNYSTSISTSNTPNQSGQNTIFTMTSPMIGVVFLTPAPDKPPYVVVGQKIKKGDELCIIEACKLFNEIASETSGEIVKILVKEGQEIQLGQPIFEIKTS